MTGRETLLPTLYMLMSLTYKQLWDLVKRMPLVVNWSVVQTAKRGSEIAVM